MRWKRVRLAGWGRARWSEADAARPERIQGVAAALADSAPATVIARGAGRAYGDQAQNTGGRVVLMERLNRLLAFDEATGELTAEAGVTFHDLLEVFLPRGFLAPVAPGTGWVTLGGAVANDVHGKNHCGAGGFGDHVRWLELLLPSGEVRRISPRRHPELFATTIGGMGLTGIILAVCLRLVRVPSNAALCRWRRIADLEAFLAAFAELPRLPELHAVGWIDGLASGGSLGRGILEVGIPCDQPVDAEAHRPHPVPLDLPGACLNRLTLRTFNAVYLRRVPARGRVRQVRWGTFLHPLDRILDWNRLYGRRGFQQFQCALPAEQSARGLRSMLETAQRHGRPPFLAVIKRLGGAGRGHLSFPLLGHTLALDFPNGPGIAALYEDLVRLTLDHGGRVYPAKDALLPADPFAAMYPKLPAFERVLAAIDPDGRMSSDLACRLGIGDAARRTLRKVA